MRLIDADKLEDEMYYNAFETDTDMQKWESGCWVRYKMFENILEKQPTIEAIPIEWIKRYWSDLIETNSIAKWGIKRMVYEWEDENGQLKESERNIARIIDWREENGTDTI